MVEGKSLLFGLCHTLWTELNKFLGHVKQGNQCSQLEFFKENANLLVFEFLFLYFQSFVPVRAFKRISKSSSSVKENVSYKINWLI